MESVNKIFSEGEEFFFGQRDNTINTREIFARIKEIAGLKRDDELARLLALSPQSLGGYKSRDTLPINQLIRWVGQKNVSLDYLLLGIGPVKRENLDFEKENRDLRKRIERLEGAIELAKDLLRDVFGKDIDEKKL
jgi:hypothetical protein|tara:strand:- start:125 stop:532 length:408 start_codon:yes stop_codon:yes gene_type:complete